MKVIGACPEGLILKRTHSELKQPFVRWIAGQKVFIQCQLKEVVDVKVYLYTNLMSGDEKKSELYEMNSENKKDFEIDYLPTQPVKGYYRILLEAEKKGEFYSDGFFQTSVEIQPKGLDLIRLYSFIPLASGPMKNWGAKLAEIKKMGFDCVHFLPITKMGASQSPYSAADLYQVDPLYSEAESELAQFVDSAKDQNLRLCFDLVLNHISPDSSLVKKHPDWIQPDASEPDGFKRAGCWHESSWICWDDLVLIHFDHPEPATRRAIWKEMTQYALYWAELAMKTDGMIRLDNLHSSHVGFVDHLRLVLKKAYPNLILFAEFFADDETLLKKSYEWDLNLLLGQPWHHNFIPELRRYFEKMHEQSAQLHHVMPITTHDTPAIQEMYSDASYTIPRYAASSLLSCGKTGVTMGVELAEPEKLKFIGEPYDLDILQADPFKESISDINKLMEEQSTLRGNGNLKFIDGEHHAYMAAFREDPLGEGSDLLVFVSMDKYHEHEFWVDFSAFYSDENRPKHFVELSVAQPEKLDSGSPVLLRQCDYRVFKSVY